MGASAKRTINNALRKWNMVQKSIAPMVIFLSCFGELWSIPPVKNNPNFVWSETNRYISTKILTSNNHMPGGDCLTLMWFVRSSQKAECIPVLVFDGYFSSSTRKRREMWLHLPRTEGPWALQKAVPTYWRASLNCNFIENTA